jgi:hypothetical protein
MLCVLSIGGGQTSASRGPSVCFLPLGHKVCSIAMMKLLAATLAACGVICHANLRGTASCLPASFESYPNLDLSPLCDDTAWTAPVEATTGEARRLRADETVITGVAQTFMEDHFKENKHFMYTVVKTVDGRSVRVDVPHGEEYSGAVVRWAVREKSSEEQARDAKPGQQKFPKR